MTKKATLRDWQVAGATTCIGAFKAHPEGSGFYLQWDPGMGKTLGAIAVARFMKLERIVVVCPVIAIGVWEREISKWWPAAHVAQPDELDGLDGRGAPVFVVTAYDRLFDRVPGKAEKKRASGGRARLMRLSEWQPELLILDEAQYVKGNRAKRTIATMRLAQMSKYRLLLSGTPAHSPLDWWSQYKIINPKEPLFAQPYQNYRDQILELTGPNGNWPKRGPDGKPLMKPGARVRLLDAMAPYTHHADASEVNLPDPIESIVPVPLTAVERKHYREMMDYLRTELDPETEAEASIVLTKMLRLAQISAGFVTDNMGQIRDLGVSKLDACVELIDERPEQKGVVSCRFKHDITRLRRTLEARGIETRTIDGATPQADRTAAEDWFQKQPGRKVLLLQQRAGGVAITLSEADYLIFFTLEPSVIAWRQTWGRVWRIGQTGNVQIIYLVGERTQDEVMLLALKAGASLVDLARAMLNNIRQELGHAPSAVL